MKSAKFISIAFLAIISAIQLYAQRTESELNEIAFKEISPQVQRLTWTAILPEACGDTITYSVFRGKDENFEASQENQIASGVTVTHYVTHEPKPLDLFTIV